MLTLDFQSEARATSNFATVMNGFEQQNVAHPLFTKMPSAILYSSPSVTGKWS